MFELLATRWCLIFCFVIQFFDSVLENNFVKLNKKSFARVKFNAKLFWLAALISRQNLKYSNLLSATRSHLWSKIFWFSYRMFISYVECTSGVYRWTSKWMKAFNAITKFLIITTDRRVKVQNFAIAQDMTVDVASCVELHNLQIIASFSAKKTAKQFNIGKLATRSLVKYWLDWFFCEFYSVLK